MPYGLFINKTNKRIIYEREFFTENKSTRESPYHGLISIEGHNEFKIVQLNRSRLYKEKLENSSKGFCLKYVPAYIGDDIKTIMELNNGKFIIDVSPSLNFKEIEITAGIEKILRDTSIQGEALKKFGSFLVRRGHLSSK